MAWTYSAWRRQATPAARATMLAQHLEEIEDKITADVSADGKSRQNHPLNSLLEHLEGKYESLVASLATAGGAAKVRFRKTR